MKKEWLDYCTSELITNLLTDNGMLGRWDKPLEAHLNTPLAKNISKELASFLAINPHILLDIDQFLEDAAMGDVDENEEKYGSLVWWEELNQSVEEFFNEEEVIE